MTALHVATLALASILVIAAVGKLRGDDADTREEWDELGVPAALNRRWLRSIHPIAELAVVILALLPGPASLAGALGMVALTTAYLVLIVAAWRRPEPVACTCFGSAWRSEITGRTVVRNALLVTLGVCALLAVVIGRGSPWDAMLDPSGAVVNAPLAAAMGLLALAAGWFSAPGSASTPASVVEQSSANDRPRTATRHSRLPAGQGTASAVGPTAPTGETAGAIDEELEEEDYLRTLTPRAPVVEADGSRSDLVTLSARGAVLLIFASYGCGPCRQIVDDLGSIRERLPMLDVRVISSLAPKQLDKVPDEWRSGALYDEDGLAAIMLQVSGTPAAVLLGADGMLAGGPALGLAAVLEMIDEMEIALAQVHETQLDPTAGRT